jgi:stress response protein YsnF
MKSRFDDNVNLDQDNSSSIKIETETTTTTPNYDDSSSSRKEKKVIPLMAEKLDVIKTELVDEAIITKEPIKETKTKQIPNMHEELVIERRPVIDDSLS